MAQTHDAAMYEALKDGRSMSMLSTEAQAVEMMAKVGGWKLAIVTRMK